MPECPSDVVRYVSGSTYEVSIEALGEALKAVEALGGERMDDDRVRMYVRGSGDRRKRWRE